MSFPLNNRRVVYCSSLASAIAAAVARVTSLTVTSAYVLLSFLMRSLSISFDRVSMYAGDANTAAAISGDEAITRSAINGITFNGLLPRSLNLVDG